MDARQGNASKNESIASQQTGGNTASPRSEAVPPVRTAVTDTVSGSDTASNNGRTTQTASTATARTRRVCCTSPEEVFAIANALTVLFASQLNQTQMQTLINLLSLLVAGLSTIVTQQQICQGVEVIQTPVE